MLNRLKKKKKTGTQGKKAPSPAASNPQGIGASGNATYRVALTGLIVATLVIVGSFAYLLLVREPGLKTSQADRVAGAFATQQATNLHSRVLLLRQRLQSAARSPLALSAIASRSQQDIELVEQAVLDYFPDLISLKLVPVGDMGTAVFEGGDQGLRNHIEVDLVRRTASGEKTLPEAFTFEDRWLTTIAELVQHPRMGGRRAVLVASVDNKTLAEQLGALNAGTGKYELEQLFTARDGKTRTTTIAQTGSGDATRFRRFAVIPDSNWRVAFTPSSELVATLGASSISLYIALAFCLLAAVAGFAIVALRLPRIIGEDVNHMISAADRKSELKLSIPELVGVARQLRRATLRALRQSASGSRAHEALPSLEVETLDSFEDASSAADLDDVLELDLAAEEPPGPAALIPPGFPAHIFRAYDIRGDAGEELTEDMMARIGLAIGTVAEDMGEQTLLVGADGRLSSPALKAALVRALMESGRDVIDIGLVPTPVLYFATRHLDCRSGLMVTGSHNPRTDNGLKIVLNQQTIHAGGIEDLRSRVLEGNFSSGNGRMIKEQVIDAYIDEVVQDVAIAVPLKVVIDAGNGATSEVAPLLFEELGCEVVPMYCEIDGNFPNHSPDTSNEDNLRALCEAVKQEEADFGVAFDGDGDRLAVVTGTGRIVRSDILLMLFAQDVVSRNPGADVVFDVKCSRNLTELITRYGGRPILWKTGHAFMKEKMAETGALLGGEFSGHMFFGERWFGFDDGMYAAARLAEIMSTQGDTLDDMIDAFPATVNTPEILIPVAEDQKYPLMDRIIRNTDFSYGKVNTMDGIRVDFADGWGLLRASNTSPALTARFEASTQEALDMIISEFREQVALVDSSLELNF
ncbi:phosphomannomutase/phosphoglucomutase [Pseudohalioglobus lutimaris]|uniref:phosphomannomutase n=1 Tax=Pseudohalioglobus lutimaris TaxID=1737061 RepID=A0A2N5X8Z3_9GAMM|nr:phosphomannomutase/phosphoglucomutase [Pseudohalioglobus lutimaris]PLW70951.1 phosphomannomutase/phosphoglucomutase [Pseudohalioglobus lutimaris]